MTGELVCVQFKRGDSIKCRKTISSVGVFGLGLVWFYGTSTIEDYSCQIQFYTYKQFYFNNSV